MKQTAVSTTDMLHKIEAIEKEITSLKLSVLKGLTSPQKKIVRLKGILKGVEITDTDLLAAKKYLSGRISI